jgi:hypothetical protein
MSVYYTAINLAGGYLSTKHGEFMNKLLPNILGITLLTGGIASFGSYPKSAQLSCQKVQVHTAICRTEIDTVAGWGKAGINEYPEIRQAKVALVKARSSSNQVKLYPIMLISKAGQGLRLEEVSRNSESASNEIAQKINQFLQSTQTKTMIDLRSDAWSDVYGFHGQVVGKQNEDSVMACLTGGIVFTLMGSLLLIVPWWKEISSLKSSKQVKT